MKNIFLILFFGMFLISFISAIDSENLEAGKNYTIHLSEPYHHYKITENTSKVDINITQEGNDAIIQTSKYMENCSFKITFYGEHEKILGGGGGGSYSEESDNESSIDKGNYTCKDYQKECTGNSLWYCENGIWKSKKCEFGCENKECLDEPTEEPIEEQEEIPSPPYIAIIMIGIILLIILFYILKEKTSERRYEEYENETEI